MTPNVRIFPDDQSARNADEALAEHGLARRTLITPSAVAGREDEAVETAIADGLMPDRYRKLCARSLREGRSLIAVATPFGAGETATLVMEEHGGTVYLDLMRRYRSDEAAPLSAALGLPTVVGYTPSTSLVSNDWSLSSLFGMRLLSKNPAPLSSLIGWRPLSKPKKGPWKSSFGFPMLVRNPAPLSSLFALRVLSKPKGPRREWRSSFGLPLLARNPAPLSSLLGFSTLWRYRRGDK